MKISQEGIELIKKFEGCKLETYRCSADVPTIGYGHTRDVAEDMHIAALNGFTDRYGYAYRGVYDLLDDYYFSKSNNNSEYTEDEIKEKGVITMDFGMITGV